MGLDFIQTRRRVEPISAALNADYSKSYSPGIYDSFIVKFSGLMTASGPGTNALDGPFGMLGKVEWVLGDEPIIVMHGSDIRHLASMLAGGHAEILPSSIANGSAFLAQAKLDFSRLIPNAGVDARKRDLVVRGRTRGATNLGTTVTGISSGKLRFSGETTALTDGDHFEPHFLSSTIDISTQSSEHKGKFSIGTDYTVCCGLFLRQFDASLESGDPNSARADYLVREVRVVLNSGGKEREIARATWGELKFDNTAKWQISAASGQISSGVAFLDFHDPEHPETGFNPVFMKDDVITVYADTLSTLEDEFTGVAHAAGDLFYFTPLNFIPRGDNVDAARAQAARDRNHEERISAARAQALRLQG